MDRGDSMFSDDLIWISPEPNANGVYDVCKTPIKGWIAFVRLSSMAEDFKPKVPRDLPSPSETKQ